VGCCKRFVTNGRRTVLGGIRGREMEIASMVLILGLIGTSLGYGEIAWRCKARLEEFGVDNAGLGRFLVDYLGRKQALDRIESNNLVGEFC
jgi:hypothetical protein